MERKIMGANQLAPPPAGFDSPVPPPPAGFDFAQPATELPPPPPGFDSPSDPLHPDKTPSPEKTNTEVPGFWQTVGSAFGRGTTERVAADIAGARVALPKGLGGKTLEETYQEGLLQPETKDEISSLLGKKVNQGWSDPKWWGAQVAHGTGSMVPAVGAAGVGALGGIPMPVMFGVEGGIGTIVPAYKAARAAGLEPEEATTRALVDSGIAASTAVAMGLAPQIALYGKMQNPAVTDQVAQMLKRPVMEMLTQLGLVQPSLAISGHLATSLTHGEVPDGWDLATTGVVGAGMGVVPLGTHAAIRAGAAARRSTIPSEPVAGSEAVTQAFEAQNIPPNVPPPPAGFDIIAPPTGLDTATGKPSVIRPSEPPAVPASFDETLYPRESRIFFSPVKRAIEEKLPDNASVDQTIATIRNAPGVKQEEIMDLGLPSYLAGLDGKVNKKDLLAHIEESGLILEEAKGGVEFRDENAPGYNTLDRGAGYPDQILPGEHSNYREFVLKIPQRGESLYGNLSPKIGGEPERIPDPSKNYSISHWPEDVNPIAHIRVTDRSDRNGRNLLHVEEIQSDLHQDGRKNGYRDPTVRPFDELIAERRNLNRIEDELYARYPEILDRGTDEILRLSKEGKIPQEVLDYFRKKAEHVSEYRKSGLNEGKVPDLPFKTSWPELAIKRILRLAADEGYDGISWSNGDQVGLRLATPEQLRGAREFYDKIVPSLMKKWAKKLGMETGETRLFSFNDVHDTDYSLHPMHEARIARMGLNLDHMNDRVGFIEVNPAAGSRIRQGLPLYEQGPQAKITLSEAIKKGAPKELVEPAKKLIQMMGQLGKDVRLSRGIEFDIRPQRATWRGKVEGALNAHGEYVMRVNTRLLSRPEDLYATMAHEFGHIIQRDKFASAPDSVKLQIAEAFKQFRLQMNQQARTVGDVRRVRDNAVSEMTGGRNTDLPGRGQLNDLPLSELQPRSRSYLLHFDEWFAEQTAKWATTSEKPLSRVDKFFAEVGKTVRNLIQKFTGKASAERVMQDWLDSLIPDSRAMADVMDKMEFDTKRRNADALARDGTPQTPSTPATASTVGGRNILDSLPPDLVGSSGAASAAHADRMNRFYEWMMSLPQIAELNKHIRELVIYKEIVASMNIQKNNIMGDAKQTQEAWAQLRDPKQQFALNKFIEDYMNGMFKDPSDTSGTIRRPTAPEFAALVSKHNLGEQALRLFTRIQRDFDGAIHQYRDLLHLEADKITDPAKRTQAKDDIEKTVGGILQRPYFPAMRFGKYTITVYDSAGNIRHLEQTDSLRKQEQIKKVLEKSSDLLPGDEVRKGELYKDSMPLVGMPRGLLELIADKLDLSDNQKSNLEVLKFDYAPAHTFRHNLKAKDVTPGYSTDFMRAYANFFFHFANHITRVQWADALRQQINDVKKASESMEDGNKRMQVANYMTEHLNMLLDPKPDFAALRGLMFHWYLGFNPASATLNLSQIPLMSFPHLASKFGGLGIGDLKAAAALLKASTEINNFYRRGKILEDGIGAPAGSWEKAAREFVREGVLSETQAHTLAAISEDRNLFRAFGSKAEAAWLKFAEASSWMFEMTEQYNRRITARAAWSLAMKEPNNKYVAETIRDNPLQYKRLRDSGWTHQEAAAFTAAKHSTEATQFVYAPYARPKFMWGRKGALFIFKSFVQNTLFNLYNNPAAAGRSLLILGALGGLMGLPGTEDVNGIIKALGWRLFGKDWDAEDQARKFAVDVLKGVIGPDMLLHGISTKGFGIPHVMNALGAQAGLPKWFPTLDRHGSIGMGNILPVEPGKLFGPSKTPATAELAQLQRASGAGFSNIFAMYNFLTSQQSISDMKRWEGIMPRAASNVSHAFRYFSEGQERNRRGNSVVKFDVGDTEQMAEILARAAGYQPRRLTAAWEAISAKTEAETYWQLRQQILLRQFGEAVKKASPEDKATVLQAIRNYNQELTEPHLKPLAITGATLKDSVMARMRSGKKQEIGLPQSNKAILLYKEMDKYFPEGRPTGQVDARPVK